MLLVVDFNVVFSLLIRTGIPFKVFEANRIFNKFRFISPEFILSEINKKIDKISKETNLSQDELQEVISFINKQVEFIPYSEFIDKLPEAIKINYKDSPYLALALKFNCPIFSGDKKLKGQNRVKVYSPRELLDMFGMK